jgi:glycosyltransferase involved in cell wall biosynthesis
MRILVLGTNLDRPEAAIFAGLARKGAHVHVVVRASSEHDVTLREAGVEITNYEFSSRFDLRGMRLVRAMVREGAYDIVYATSNRALSTAVVGLWGVSVKIATYRGTVGHISWFDPTSWFTFLSPKVSKILCVSRAVERYLVEIGIRPERVTTIYKGHRIEWYQVASKPNRSEFGIPSDAFVVNCTAVMREVKGVDDLLDAASLLVNEIPALHVLLIGPIKDPAISQRVSSFPAPERLHTLGFRADATALAQLADVTVMASKNREGFPKSVVEAMAQGIPAIVTAVGGMPELVGDGVAGLLVEPKNPQSIAEAIRTMYGDRDLRTRLGHAAKERIATTFNVDETVERTFCEFQALCS